jgi:hypothetical protein
MEYRMRMNTKIFVLVLLASGSSQAAGLSTQWTLRNEAKEPLTISCRNTTVKPLEIVLPEQTIPAAGEKVYDWGDLYYNDGLWLNAGSWSCQVQAQGASRRTETFSTGWGEAITLVMNRSDGQIRFRKIPNGPPTAKKALQTPHSTESR